MHSKLTVSCFLALGFIESAFAAAGLNSVDRWLRVDLRWIAKPRNASEIKVEIRTHGPSMQGLIRIPGGIASNFDTGAGSTVVDLINVSDQGRGYPAVVAVEVLATQSMPNQSFEVWAVEP